ncbi:hypothetical protein IWQ57_002417 [Coemansia nantahalensis]|uniref:Uncharacterized protein n=1 Tax=Coemansia nantahalensis TaxID=2789366 RepID=A0ACC1K0N1_9FUNG|nr:hypothetical protein IWQ57_002417 [Coemansia nantahalensis]
MEMLIVGGELAERVAHWGPLAAATYQHPDISDAEVAASWSTAEPAFSREFVGVDHQRQQQTHWQSRRFPAHRQLVSFGSSQVGNRRFAQLLVGPRASDGEADEGVPHLPRPS